jgi:hypothetical protein
MCPIQFQSHLDFLDPPNSAQSIIKILTEEHNENEHNILVPSEEGSNSQVHHHMKSESDGVCTEIKKKK